MGLLAILRRNGRYHVDNKAVFFTTAVIQKSQMSSVKLHSKKIWKLEVNIVKLSLIKKLI